jgi:hypothetical protein
MDSHMSDRVAEELAESLLPGWKVVRAGDRMGSGSKAKGENTPSDIATMPSLEVLKSRYAGVGASRPTDDTAIVTLRNGLLTTAVAVSKSERRIVWSQG